MPTLRLAYFLRPELVLWDLEGGEKSDFLRRLAAQAAGVVAGVEAAPLADLLLAREAEGTTAVGQGLALPHAMVEGLAEPSLVIARLADSVDFGAADHEPVDLVFLVISPAGGAQLHLRLLARVARLATQATFLAQLRTAGRREELYRVLVEEDARHVY